MTISCRISDEQVYNPWESENNSLPKRTLENLTIAELMGEDHAVWLGKNKQFGFILEIENDEGQTILEKCIHPYAIESLASFCRRFINSYEKIQD
jgi:hypothetical protein